MAKPIAPWEADADFLHEDLVWLAHFDERYQIEVHRTEDNANLYIFDHDNDNVELACFPVALTHGSDMEPTLNEMLEWQGIVEEVVGDSENPSTTH